MTSLCLDMNLTPRQKRQENRWNPKTWSYVERYRPNPPSTRLMHYKWIGKNYKDLTEEDEKNKSEFYLYKKRKTGKPNYRRKGDRFHDGEAKRKFRECCTQGFCEPSRHWTHWIKDE